MKKVTNRDQCWQTIVEALRELLEEMGEDPGAIEPGTRLGADLGITSVDVIHLALLLEDRFKKPLRFQDLLVVDGDYVTDVTAGQILEFLARGLGLADAGAPR